jgi:hypothetical protein
VGSGPSIAQQPVAYTTGASFMLMDSAVGSTLGQVFGCGVFLADVLGWLDVCLNRWLAVRMCQGRQATRMCVTSIQCKS